jgi:hypothetical protein
MTLWQQVVAGIAIGDLDDVTALADCVDVATEYDSHLGFDLVAVGGADVRVEVGLLVLVLVFVEIEVLGSSGTVLVDPAIHSGYVLPAGAQTPRATTRPALIDRTLRVRQQGHLPGRLDGDLDIALVLCTVTGDPTSPDLSPVAHEPAQKIHILVVHPDGPVLAKDAHLLLAAGSVVFDGSLRPAVPIVVSGHG